MRKLKLQLEDLQIDSFSTSPVQKKDKGTIFGEQCTYYTNWDASCNGTCGDTCDESCDGACTWEGSCGCEMTYAVYTCEGYATYGGPVHLCVVCGGGGSRAC